MGLVRVVGGIQAIHTYHHVHCCHHPADSGHTASGSAGQSWVSKTDCLSPYRERDPTLGWENRRPFMCSSLG